MSTAEARVLRLDGELTLARAGAIWRAVLEAPPPVAIELAGVTGLDSAGVALLLALGDEAERRGQPRPELRGLPQRYHDLCRAHRVENGNGHV